MSLIYNKTKLYHQLLKENEEYSKWMECDYVKKKGISSFRPMDNGDECRRLASSDSLPVLNHNDPNRELCYAV